MVYFLNVIPVPLSFNIINDLFESGITDDKLAMIYESNKMNRVSVKTPVGQTDRTELPTIVAQGGSLGSTLCSVQTDKFGKEAVLRQEK